MIMIQFQLFIIEKECEKVILEQISERVQEKYLVGVCPNGIFVA